MSKVKGVRKRKSDLELVLSLIEARQKTEEQLLEEAIQGKRWSQVSGRDGIAIGLMLAANIIQECMKHPYALPEDARAHDAHCCRLHGCKYGDDMCPVVKGYLPGVSCEECQ